MTTSQLHLSHPKYRPDIDGLRAIAVLSVVAFHAFPDCMKGGFIGVDVFFVISGYLISTIIFENLDRGIFSFTEFYARRISRIFPALIIVLVSCYVFGWFFLLADEYKQLGKHLFAGAGFVSNIVLWGEAGYFDNSAETKPLLHLWSLGIEEQFYIAWPLFIWISWKRNFNLLTITIVVALISFALNVSGATHDAVATFYSPQTRFWELLSGALLAGFTLYKNRISNNIKDMRARWLVATTHGDKKDIGGNMVSNALSLAGVILLAYGFWGINKNSIFPGKWALVPVLGSLLIISAGQKSWFNRTILSNKIVIWFGLISFPLYLWHWPLLSYARIIEIGTPSTNLRIATVFLSIFLSWLTYKFIERPVRSGGSGRKKIAVLVVLMTIVGFIGGYTWKRDGLAFRTKDREDFVGYFENSFPTWSYFKKINLSVEWRSECAFFNGKKYLEEGRLEGGVTDSKPIEEIAPSCYVRDFRFDKAVLIWGDSHAQALSPGVVNYMPKNWQVLQIASSGCPPNPNLESPSDRSQCNQSNYFAMKTIRDTAPDVVIVAQSNGHSIKNMADILYKLKGFGVKRVLFVGPTPQWKTDLPKIIARQLWVTKPMRTFVGIDQEIIIKNERLMREFGKEIPAEYVDIIGLLCNKEGCLTHTSDDIEESITTWDYGHLTPSASKYLAKHLLVERIVME